MIEPIKQADNIINQPKQSSAHDKMILPIKEHNTLERIPENDKLEKEKKHTVRNIAIGTAAALILAVLADYKFAEGKHVKKLLGIAEKDGAKPGEGGKPSGTKPDSKPTETTKTDHAGEHKSESSSKGTPKTDQEGEVNPGNSQSQEASKASNSNEVPSEPIVEVTAAEIDSRKLVEDYIKSTDILAVSKAKNLLKNWNDKLRVYSEFIKDPSKKLKKVKHLNEEVHIATIKNEDTTTKFISHDGKSIDKIEIYNNKPKFNLLGIKLFNKEELTHEIRVEQYLDSTDFTFVQNGNNVERIIFDTANNRIKIWNDYTTQKRESGFYQIYFKDKDLIRWDAKPPKDISKKSLSGWKEFN